MTLKTAGLAPHNILLIKRSRTIHGFLKMKKGKGMNLKKAIQRKGEDTIPNNYSITHKNPPSRR